MQMRKTIYSRLDVEVKHESVFELIRNWIVAKKFIVMRKRVGLTLNGKDFGHIDVVLFPKFKFTRVGE